MSLLINGTTKTKVDCSKECPCGVPVIPVPEQWLEVMVTGGFKVWHIIFIIIALIITLIVVYCCFHRCRIPRTKQEIEADLMRTNITNKFRDYLSEFPNEPTTFIEALKRVQEIEEKSEKDDAFAREANARKKRGWLKLKGGKNEQKEPPDKSNDQVASNQELETVKSPEKTQKQPSNEPALEITNKPKEEPPAQLTGQNIPELSSVSREESGKLGSIIKKSGSRVKRLSKDTLDASMHPMTSKAPVETIPKDIEASKLPEDVGEQKVKHVRRRRHKPNLSRTRRTGEVDLEKGVVMEPYEDPNLAVQTTTTKQHVHRVRIEPDV